MFRNLRWTPESTFGTFDSSSTAGLYLPQDTPGSFQNLTKRPAWTIKSGSGRNIPRVRGSEIYSIGGKYANRLYWENYILALWVNPINTGQTTPWPTNCRPTDLASATFDFAYSHYDLSLLYKRWTGVKPGANWKIEAGNDGTNPFLMIEYDLIGSMVIPNAYTADAAITITDLPTPTESQLPINPITFQECVFTYNGGAANFFDKFTISGQCMTKPYFDNSRFANRISHNGRTVTLSAHLRFDAANDPRTRYEAVTALGNCSLTFNKPGAGSHALTFNFRSNSYMDDVAEETPLDDDAYTTLTAVAHLDSGTGDDFIVTYV